MAARIQGLVIGVGKSKQTAIGAASASFLRFKKLDQGVTPVGLVTEDDAPEIGKQTEFATQVFPVAFEPTNTMEKYCEAVFATWAWAFALGNVAEAVGVYTIVPIDPGTTIELPYTSIVEQLAEGGANSIDNLFIDCAIESVMLEFNSSPGRQSCKLRVVWMGAGKLSTPSGVVVPTLATEYNMLGASMALTINGTDYVAGGKIVSGSYTWTNNLTRRFFPGSGIQSGAAIAGGLEIGARTSDLRFKARLLNGSTEQTKLLSQITGPGTLSIQFDSTHSLAFSWPAISYKSVVNDSENGLSTVSVQATTKYLAGIVTVTAKCGTVGIGQ